MTGNDVSYMAMAGSFDMIVMIDVILGLDGFKSCGL